MTAARPFVSPPRVLAGAGASADLGRELLALGAVAAGGPALLVVDAAVLGLGLEAGVATGLREAGFEVRVGPAIEAEPTLEMVDGCIATVEHGAAAAVVGIGGGSAMDAAKLVAAGLANPGRLEAGFGADATLQPGPALALVPTTAGTGAEATAVAMLWRGFRKQIFVHPDLVPARVVLDPELTQSLPPNVTASGGLDAISHAVESVLSTFRTPMTTAVAHAALTGLADALPEAFAHGTPRSRYTTLVGAYNAGLALNASVVIGHSVAYTIAARTGLPHGLTCAMALPYCLAYCRPEADERMAALAGTLGLGRTSTDLLGWLTGLNATMDIPASLTTVGIDASHLADMARECVETYPRPNNPVPVTQTDVERLLAFFLTGNIDGAWSSMWTGSPVLEVMS